MGKSDFVVGASLSLLEGGLGGGFAYFEPIWDRLYTGR